MEQTSQPKTLPTRILGIDYGLSRIGLAISDERKIIATPQPNLLADKNSGETAKKLLTEIHNLETKYKCRIECVVIGLPLMMSGKTGFLADEVKHFVELLSALISIPIKTWDERLTTVQAERSLLESSLTRKKRAKIVDSISAIIILQNYLDSLSFHL